MEKLTKGGKIMRSLLFVLLIFLSASVYANTTCRGKLKSVSLNPDSGTVHLNYGFGTQYHCKINQEWNGVSPETCRTLFSMLLAAQLAGKRIEARYNGDFECSSENLGNHTRTQRLMYWINIVD